MQFYHNVLCCHILYVYALIIIYLTSNPFMPTSILGEYKLMVLKMKICHKSKYLSLFKFIQLKFMAYYGRFGYQIVTCKMPQ
jgi:hypothetical protein